MFGTIADFSYLCTWKKECDMRIESIKTLLIGFLAFMICLPVFAYDFQYSLPVGYTEIEYIQAPKDRLSKSQVWTVPNNLQENYNYILEFTPLSWEDSYYGHMIGGNNEGTVFPRCGIFKLDNGWGGMEKRFISVFWNYNLETRSQSPGGNYRVYTGIRSKIQLHCKNYDSSQGAEIVVDNKGYTTYTHTSTKTFRSGYSVQQGVYDIPILTTKDGNIERGALMQLHNFRVEDRYGNAIYNYVPCIRNSDSKVGLYDVVNSAFYYPTAFTLTAGPEVQNTSTNKFGEVADVVDLGLSVKWASWNIGALSPEEYGSYFSWGETSPKSDYSWSTYKFGNPPNKYNSTDNKKTLDPSDDAAVVLWGDKWRMPTNEEEKELYDKCTWKYTKNNGINGYQVTGPNGNSIFLPAAGLYDGNNKLASANSIGWYWSSTSSRNQYALGLYLTSSSVNYADLGHDKCDGHVIRPVYDDSGSSTPDYSAKRTIHVATAGTLPNLISESEKYTIEELTLTGELNGTDFRLLRDMAGNNYLGKKTNGKLKYLDMINTKIVSGGLKYLDTKWISWENGGGSVDKEVYVESNKIPYKVFAGCTINTILIPNSVVTICDHAFWYCQLKAIVISNSVLSIEKSAFEGCKLLSLTIPSSVTSIETPILSGNNDLEIIRVDEKNGIYDSRDNCNAIIETQFNTLVAGCKKTKIPNSVTTIGRCAFLWCESLTSITIPYFVGAIEDQAFYGCRGLAKVVSKIQTPFWISNLVFAEISSDVELIVPEGTTAEYQSKWNYRNNFSNITESSNSGEESKITLTAKNCSREYGEANPTFDFIKEGGDIYGTPYITCDATATSPVGDYIIRIYNGGITNDNVEYVDGILTITKAQLTVKANSYTRVEGEENPSFGVIYQGFKNGETEAVLTQKPTATTTATASSKPGTYDINVSGAEAENYSFNYIKGTLTVTENNNVTYTGGGITYNCEKSSLTAEVISFDQSKSYISIPETVTYSGRTYRVTSIGGFAFYQCRNITSVIIPCSVKSIGSSAFEECTGMTSLTLSDGLLSIGGSSFEGCTGLSAITIPGTVTSIALNAFKNCSNLKDVTSKIETPFTIPENVFFGIASDATLTVPKGRKFAYQSTAGWNKFTVITDGTDFTINGITYVITSSNTVEVKSADNSQKIIVIPESVSNSGTTYWVTALAESSFEGRADLAYLSIPKTVTSIGEYAFIDCGSNFKVNITSLEAWCKVKFGNQHSSPLSSAKAFYLNDVEVKNLSIPSGVTSISSYAFYQCRSITSLSIPSTVTSIISSVFEDCTGLTSVTLSEGLTSIGGSSFEGCTGITSITIPSTVTSIALNAFKECNSLNDITSEVQQPFAIEENVFSTYSTATLKVPAGTKSAYQSTAGWSLFKNITDGQAEKDDVLFAIDGITYQGTKSGKTVLVTSVNNGLVNVEIPASVSYEGTTYQVTGLDDNALKGSSMAALIWNVEAVLPNNAFSNASIGSNFLLYVKSSSYAPPSVKNVVVDGTAQTIVLSDDGGQFYCPQAFTARRISYSHNYSMETGKGSTMGWESIALPFDVQRIIHGTQGEIVPFADYISGSNLKPFWLAYMSAGGFKRTTDIRAYEAYIIAMPNNSSYQDNYILAGDVTFSAENLTVPKTPSFNGTFLPAFSFVAKSSSVYALNVNNRFVRYSGSEKPGSVFIRDLRDIRPFEAYLTGNFTRGIIEINYDNGTTDILGVLLSTDDSKEITIHTLSGLQVARTTQHDFDAFWEQLPKGVYIVNGKKLIK